MAVSNGAILCLSTPYGKRGWWYTEWSAGDGWERVMVPAEQCSRISAVFLAQERRSLPRSWYESEYCCIFHDAEDSVFASADLQACLVAPGSVVPWSARGPE